MCVCVCVCVYVSVCVSVCLSVATYICHCVWISPCRNICLSVCLSLTNCQTVYLSVCLSVCPSVCLSDWFTYSPSHSFIHPFTHSLIGTIKRNYNISYNRARVPVCVCECGVYICACVRVHACVLACFYLFLMDIVAVIFINVLNYLTKCGSTCPTSAKITLPTNTKHRTVIKLSQASPLPTASLRGWILYTCDVIVNRTHQSHYPVGRITNKHTQSAFTILEGLCWHLMIDGSRFIYAYKTQQ